MQEKIAVQSPPPVSVSQKLPQPHRNVIVITLKYRCLGYVEPDGRWRGYSHDEIQDVVGWIPI